MSARSLIEDHLVDKGESVMWVTIPGNQSSRERAAA